VLAMAAVVGRGTRVGGGLGLRGGGGGEGWQRWRGLAAVTKAGGCEREEKKSECQTNNCLFGNDSLFGNVPNKQPDSGSILFCQSTDHSGLNSGLTKLHWTKNALE
jgi:hypothetical protein